MVPAKGINPTSMGQKTSGLILTQLVMLVPAERCERHATPASGNRKSRLTTGDTVFGLTLKDTITVMISCVALILSFLSVVYSVTARPRYRCWVAPDYIDPDEANTLDGFEVIVVNTGRRGGVVERIVQVLPDGSKGRPYAGRMVRGKEKQRVEFPSMPQTVAPGEVCKA